MDPPSASVPFPSEIHLPHQMKQQQPRLPNYFQDPLKHSLDACAAPQQSFGHLKYQQRELYKAGIN